MLIEAPELSSFLPVRHGFFTREGGVSEGIYASLNGGTGSRDEPERVRANRAVIAEQLGVAPDRLLSLHQVHGAEVVRAVGPWPSGERPKADGMVTTEPDLALAILTADCGPVLFADHANRVIGACHAGWKGALGGVLDATVDAMVALGADRAAIVAVLGPTIGRDSYEVGPDLVERFCREDEANRRLFQPGGKPGHALFDLPAYIARRLELTGVGEVAAMDLDTYADENRFYSYRRATHRGEPDYGRQISAISLTKAV